MRVLLPLSSSSRQASLARWLHAAILATLLALASADVEPARMKDYIREDDGAIAWHCPGNETLSPLHDCREKRFIASESESMWQEKSPAGAPIKIATALSMNRYSKHARLGREMKRAYLLFVEWVNTIHGGVLIENVRRPVELLLHDDHSDEGKTSLVTSITQGFVNDGVKFFLGPYGSKLTEAMAKIVNETGGVMIAPVSAAVSVYENRPRVFGTLLKAPLWFENTIRALEDKGVKSLMVIGDEKQPEEICSGINTIANGFNMKVLKYTRISSKDPAKLSETLNDFSKNMGDVEESALLGCTYDGFCRDILKAIYNRKLNFKALAFTVCVTSPGFIAEMTDMGRYVLGLTPWMPTFKTRSNVTGWAPSDFVAIYKSRYKNSDPPYQAASAFAAGIVMVEAMEKANSIEPDAVAGILKNTSFSTIFGEIEFDPDGINKNNFKAVQYTETGSGAVPATVIVTPDMEPDRDILHPLPAWSQRTCLKHLTSNRNDNIGLYGDNETCGKCPANQVTKWRKTRWFGAAAWDCELGSNCTRGQQEVCSEGECRCENCTAGRYGIAALVCLPCQAGQFSDTAAATKCDDCEAGRYTNGTGAPICAHCPPGTENWHKASDRCYECLPGHNASSWASTRCDLCPRGSNASGYKTALCSGCQPGRFSAWGGVTCEKCKKGEYQSATGFSACKECPVGQETQCDEEGLAEPPGMPDWWQYYPVDLDPSVPKHAGLRKFEPCLHSGFCLEDGYCRKGHTGILCGVCLAGYSYSLFDESCWECPKWMPNLFSTLALAAIMCFGILILTWSAIQSSMETRQMISALLKLLMNYITTMSFMALVLVKVVRTLNIRKLKENPARPSDDKMRKQLAEIFNTNILEMQTSFFSLECLIEPSLSATEKARIDILAGLRQWEYLLPEYRDSRDTLANFHAIQEQRRVYFWGLIPLILSAALVGFGLVSVTLHLHKWKDYYKEAGLFFLDVQRNGWQEATSTRKVKDYHAYMDTYNYRIFGIWRTLTLASKRRMSWWREFRESSEPLFILVTFLTFPYVMKAFLRPLSCIRPAGSDFGLRIESSMDLLCYNSDRIFWVSVVAITVCGFGVPGVCAFLLYENREKLNRERYKRTYGFLITGYEVDRRWWECFALIRKTVGQCISCLGMSSGSRIWAMLCASLFFFIQHVFYEPFDNRYEELLDRIEFRHLVCWVVWCLAILGLLMSDLESSTITYFLIGLTCIHVWFFLMISKHILRHVLDSRAEQLLRQAWHKQSKELARNAEEEHVEYTFKWTPREVISRTPFCWNTLPLWHYKLYIDTLPYLAIDHDRGMVQLAAKGGSVCEVPEEVKDGTVNMVEPPASVKPCSGGQGSFFLDVISEALEYAIVNSEINTFSVHVVELILRFGFALGSDGKRRTVTLDPTHDYTDDAHPHAKHRGSLRLALGIESSLLSALGKRSDSAQACRAVDSSKLSDEEQHKQDNEDAEVIIEARAIERDLHQQHEKQLNRRYGSRRMSTSLRHAAEEVVTLGDHKEAARAAEVEDSVEEVIEWLFHPHIFLRGLTFQELQLNLAASFMIKEKGELLSWFDAFEDARHFIHLEKTEEQVKLQDMDAGCERLQATPEDIDNDLAVDIKTRRMILGLDDAADCSEVQLSFDDLDNPDDGGTASSDVWGFGFVHWAQGTSIASPIVGHWWRFLRGMLLTHHRRHRGKPWLHRIEKEAAKAQTGIGMRTKLLKHELNSLREEIEMAEAKLRHENGARAMQLDSMKSSNKEAKKQHADLCKQMLRMRDEVKKNAEFLKQTGKGKKDSHASRKTEQPMGDSVGVAPIASESCPAGPPQNKQEQDAVRRKDGRPEKPLGDEVGVATIGSELMHSLSNLQELFKARPGVENDVPPETGGSRF